MTGSRRTRSHAALITHQSDPASRRRVVARPARSVTESSVAVEEPQQLTSVSSAATDRSSAPGRRRSGRSGDRRQFATVASRRHWFDGQNGDSPTSASAPRCLSSRPTVVGFSQSARRTWTVCTLRVVHKELKMSKLVRRFVREDQGQDLVEYAMLLALIALVVAAGVTTFGTALQRLLQQPVRRHPAWLVEASAGRGWGSPTRPAFLDQATLVARH